MQLSIIAGMRTVVPFCVSIPSLVDNLSKTWLNGMLMQMLDPAALNVLGNEMPIANHPKVISFLPL